MGNTRDKFNIFAFLLTFLYSMYKSRYIEGVILLVIAIFLPIRYYFILGLYCGFFVPVVKCKVTVCSIFLSVVSILVFTGARVLKISLMGGM